MLSTNLKVYGFQTSHEALFEASDRAGACLATRQSRLRLTAFLVLCRRTLTAGDVFGEVAFFTEVTQHEGIRSTSVCRVLTIPRTAYTTIAQTFPIGSRSVLDNLLARAQQARTVLSQHIHKPLSLLLMAFGAAMKSRLDSNRVEKAAHSNRWAKVAVGTILP